MNKKATLLYIAIVLIIASPFIKNEAKEFKEDYLNKKDEIIKDYSHLVNPDKSKKKELEEDGCVLIDKTNDNVRTLI